MGTAASIHSTPTNNYTSLSTNRSQPKFDPTRLQPIFTTPNIFGPKRSLSSERKRVSSHSPFRPVQTRKVIKANTNNLTKAVLLQKLRHRNLAPQPAFDDCDVPLSTEGSQAKVHCPNHLLNKFELENFDGNKTTTDSIDTGCAKLSPKTVIFHPQGGMYFKYDDVQENEVTGLVPEKYEMDENISLEQPSLLQKDINIPLQQLRINNHVYHSFGLSSKQNSMQNIPRHPETENNCTEESESLKTLTTTPEKQKELETIVSNRPARRLNLKSKSASRNKKEENTNDQILSNTPFSYKGDTDLRNYAMISEYIVQDKLGNDRLLTSDSKASVLPSERRTYGKSQENEEEQPHSSRQNSNNKPVPKHKLLLQASKMKRERSCEALSSARAKSIGTRDTLCHEPTSAGRVTTGVEIPLPNLTSPDKFEVTVAAQPQMDAKWENFFNATNQMKKEINEFIKDNALMEDVKTEVAEQKEPSPANMKDQQIVYFTPGTLSLSGSTPYVTNDNQKLAQDFISGNQIVEVRKEIPSPFSPLKRKHDSPKKNRFIRVDSPGTQHGESFNTQILGTGTIDFQVMQMKNSMESFDPPPSCYESNLTCQLDKEKEMCVVDLLAKDNNSEYNRENYQSVLSDMNQKIDGILQKCNQITDKTRLDLIQKIYLGTSISHTLGTEGVETVPDQPITQRSPARASPEKSLDVEEAQVQQTEEIETIEDRYTQEERKQEPVNNIFSLKPYRVEQEMYLTEENEDHIHERDLELRYEDNNQLEADFERNGSPGKIEEDYMTWNYEQPKGGLYDVDEDDVEKDYSAELEIEQKEELQEQAAPEHEEESLVKIKRTLECEEELQEEEVAEIEEREQATNNQEDEKNIERHQEVEPSHHVEDTFTLESDKQSDSDILDLKHEETIKTEENDELEGSFNEEITSQRIKNDDIVQSSRKQLEKIELSLQSVHEAQLSPKNNPQVSQQLESPPRKIKSVQDWNPMKYPSIEIQRATEELESLSRALERLPNSENFVSAAGLGAVKKALVDKIEEIHNDILERISQLNKKVESRSPLSVKRRDSVLSQEHTQDTRKFDFSGEVDYRRMLLSSVRDGSKQSSAIQTPNNYSTHAKTESKPQSYSPSPFQSQTREQSQSFEPGLTFGKGNSELKAPKDLAAERLKRAQLREKAMKFQPKQVNLSIVNLIDTTNDTTAINTANNRSLSNSRIEKADKHQQSIRQVGDHSVASKLSSPLSYRSSLLKAPTRDGIIRANRAGRSMERDNELETMLESTLSRDTSNDKDPKKKTKSQNNSFITILGGQQILQQQITNEKEIREAFESRQASSPFYMSHILGTDPHPQKSRKGSYSEAKHTTVVNQSEEQWIQGEIDKKKKLAVELMNLSSLKKSRELEMPEDCMRKMDEWVKSETSSWGQIPTVREKRVTSQGVLKLQDYLANESKMCVRELNEYPLSALLARENQESVDTIFEECDSKRTTTREQGVQTSHGVPAFESYYLRQRRESKENGRGVESVQSSRIEHSRSNIGVGKMSKSKLMHEDSYRENFAKTPEKKRGVKNIHLDNIELLSTQRAGEVRSASTIKKRGVNKGVDQYSKGKHEKMYTERSGNGLPKVSKSVRNNAVVMSEMMQAYVMEQKERKYE